MVHLNFTEPSPEYVSRGVRILSVLNGEGVVDLLPGTPDVSFDKLSQSAMDKFDPDIDFDPNAYSRMDKFDALEVGQELVDSTLDSRPADKPSSEKTGTPAEGSINQP
nr:MAG TPA: hypothetical protein [Microviridae sp.]